MTTTNKQYYDFFKMDYEDYPDCAIYIAYSRRSVGKSYGFLWHCLQIDSPIVYVRRSNKEIDFLCKDDDFSPYSPINRDHGTNVIPHKVVDGIAKFVDENTDNVVGYAVSLAAISFAKGVDMSRCDFIVFDEFIPQASQVIIRASEGEAVLDLVPTVSRDRTKRGKKETQLVLFANAEDIYCPVINELQVMDDVVRLAMSGNSKIYLQDRGILIHNIIEIQLDDEETKGGLYKAMKGSKWWQKSYKGEFAHNDFSNVKKVNLNGYTPLVQIYYRQEYIYIYQKDNRYFVCKTKSNKCRIKFNFDRDNDVRMFYGRYALELRDQTTLGNVDYSDYSLYDLIKNFSKRFQRII